MRARAWIALALCALVAVVFLQVLDHAFLSYDDTIIITENAQVRAGLTAQSAWSALTTPAFANWNPLTTFSLQLTTSLFGLEPAAFLLGNVALHALGTVLLFLALARMTGAIGRSAFVAAVFAVHPLHVESVAWASERKDVLSGVFWMGTLYTYALAVERPDSSRWRGWVCALLALGLLAKPMLVTLPFALLLLDLWPLGRLAGRESRRLVEPALLWRRIVEKAPLFALAAAVSAVTYAVQHGAGAVVGSAIPVRLRLQNAALAYVGYLADAILPLSLTPSRPHPLEDLSAVAAASAAALLAGLSIAAVSAARSRPYLAVGWLWFLGTLVPVIGLVQVGNQARADRYMYLPLVGLALAAAWGAHDLAGRRLPPRALAGVGALSVLLLAGTAWRQTGHWAGTVALWERAVAVSPDDARAHNSLGDALIAAGRPEDAALHFEAALALAPAWAPPHIGKADALVAREGTAEALPHFERGLELDPDHARGHANYGLALLRLGRGGEARSHFERALALYQRAGRLSPHGAGPHRALSRIDAAAGRTGAALAHLEAALELDPDLPSAREELAQLRRRAGQPAYTEAELREALRRGVPGAANNLAWQLATSGAGGAEAGAEAVRIASRALEEEAEPTPALLDTLAAAYAAAGRFEDAVRAGERAAALLAERGELERRAAVLARVELYRTGRAYRSPAQP